jgi:3,4-dihydroxy 2-butanone 4-phosphate synthase
MSNSLTEEVARAVEAFRNGEPVLIHDFDDREAETDLVYPAEAVDAAAVARMRNHAGGLICAAVSHEVAEALDLPFLVEQLDHESAGDHDLEYDQRSSFSLPVNHRDTFTGITDEDRALTIRKVGEVSGPAERGEYDVADFAEEFRTPGHVFLLRGAPNLLGDRLGHTELALALADAADLPPAVVVCEMLDDDTGEALTTEDAKEYARENGFVFLEGSSLVDQLG